MPEWTIIGSGPNAEALRQAARFIDASNDLTVVTDGTDLPANAVATSVAALHPQAETVLSELLGFRVLEDAVRMVERGELGDPYSVFGSYRLPRGTSAALVQHEALLPLVSFALACSAQPVIRVWATSASVAVPDDCWYVTLRFADDLIITLEALAVADPATGAETLIEIIGGERVVRCEPTRQAVSVEQLGQAARLAPWWEDGAERLLDLLAGSEPPVVEGARLRSVWQAALESAQDGMPHSLA